MAFDVSQVPNQTHYQSSQSDQNLLRSDAHSSYQHSVEGHVVQPDHLSVHISQEHRARHAISGSSEVQVYITSADLQIVYSCSVPRYLILMLTFWWQALELNGKQHAVSLEPQETLDVNSEGNSTQKFDVREQKSESKVCFVLTDSSINLIACLYYHHSFLKRQLKKQLSTFADKLFFEYY